MKRSEIRRPKPTTAVIDLGDGDVLNIVFDRNKITPAWIDEADTAAKVNKDIYAVSAALALVIESWDLYEDDGVTLVPTTREEIGSLSFAAISAVMESMIEASAPSRAEGNALSEPHSIPPTDSTEQAPMPQNGQGTLPSPAPLASQSQT